jgi:hypothetical protein
MKPVLNGTAEIKQLWVFRKDFTQNQNASLQPRLLRQFASLVCSGNPFVPGSGMKDYFTYFLTQSEFSELRLQRKAGEVARLKALRFCFKKALLLFSLKISARTSH